MRQKEIPDLTHPNKEQLAAIYQVALTVRETWRVFTGAHFPEDKEECRYCLAKVSPTNGVRHLPSCPVLATDKILGEHTHRYWKHHEYDEKLEHCATWNCARRRPK